MGTTRTEIFNGTAVKLGVEGVSSDTETSDQAIAFRDAYPDAKDAALEMYGWPFATKRKVLAQASPAPPFGFEYKYPIPADCVRILGVWDGVQWSEDIVWVEENGFYLTDEDTFSIRYTSNNITEAIFGFMFAQTLQYQLAALTALKLKNSRTIMENMITLAESWSLKAQTSDARRRSRRKTKQRSSWLTARGATTTIPEAEIL